MGLYVKFDVGDYGLVTETEAIVADLLPVNINMDWAPACKAFVKTFLEEANKLVPVDTGYLRSTIKAGTDGYRCWAEASADYAEYVEYGTWCMEAQPYFEPALEKAMQVFWEVVEDIQDKEKAKLVDEVSFELEDMLASAMEFILFMLILIVLMAIVEIIDEIFEEIFDVPKLVEMPNIIIIQEN